MHGRSPDGDFVKPRSDGWAVLEADEFSNYTITRPMHVPRSVMNTPDQITVRVLKYDGQEYRRWNASIARRQDPLIVLDAEFGEDLEHEVLGDIPCGTRTIEYYWLDRWFNIFQFLDDHGGTRLFYCNVCAPATMDSQFLSYVDLDIDILVSPDLTYQVLDRDEFETNATRWNYSDATRRQVSASVIRPIAMIEGRQFPFSRP